MKSIKSVNAEIKKVIERVKEAQSQIQGIVKNQDWVDEARKYAERQGVEVKKLFAPDVEKMKSFLERERKELERFQKQIPVEVKKVRKFINMQKKEFEKLLTNVRKLSKQKSPTPKKKATKARSGKKTAANESSSENSNRTETQV